MATLDNLPDPSDPVYGWIYSNVHATYAEHFSDLYDECPDGSISLAVALTYRAIKTIISIEEPDYDDEDEGEPE